MSKHYHFIGIGGIGMGALAALLLKKDYKVSGSDIQENRMTIQLEKHGAQVSYGHDPNNVEGADYIIYSSAIAEDNLELLAANKKGIPVLQRAKLLAELMRGHIGITIAGAHGKTTTTSMISNLLIEAGLSPTTAIGGHLQGTMNHANLGKGKYFVAEVDESDGSFLYFSPQYSVITNIDYEHIDFYQNWNNILKAYSEFIEKTNKEGLIFANGEDPQLMRLVKRCGRRFQTFGFSKEFDIYAKNISFDNFTANFDCMVKGERIGSIQLPIPGNHNILNALASLSLALHLQIDFKLLQETLESYHGVQRRFQKKAQIDDIWVVDDYAHHPTEIKTVLEAAKLMKRKRILTVFQPHRYSRLKALLYEFAESFNVCDHLVITDIYSANEKPIEGITAIYLTEQIAKINKRPVIHLEKERIISHLLNLVSPGDLVLFLGAGDITHITDDFVYQLKESKVDSCEIITDKII